MSQARRYAVVAGGGTAGHVEPVLAVARAIARRGHGESGIEIVGSLRGQEGSVLQGQGFPFTLLPGRGLRRSLRPGDLVVNLRSVADLGRALWQAVRLLRAWRPRVVVTVGGYASFPAGMAAQLLRVPVVLVNTDAVPGLVHRILGRSAAASAVAFPNTPLPRTVVTGTPVRPEVAAVDRRPAGRTEARVELGIPTDRHLVVAFGGSLGAGRINEAVAGLVERWSHRDDLALYHVVGKRNWEAWPHLDPGKLWYRAVAYEQRMPRLYAACDLVVSRAGAMTVGELALTGVPAVLVPLPGAPDDHQTENALVLARAGAAELLPDHQCAAARLGGLVESLLGEPERLSTMSRASEGLGHPDAADRVAEVVTRCAR